jgi:hypothetical protein
MSVSSRPPSSAAEARERRLVDYLLGTLPPEERDELEESYFADDSVHEELQATADDLIHAYLAGTLSSEDRQRFETYFLASPTQRERLGFMRVLLANVRRSRADAGSSPSPRVRRPAMAAFAAAAVVALVAFGSRVWWRIPQASGREGIATAPSVGHADAVDPLVRFAPASMRDAELTLSTATASVRFEVAVDGHRPSYDAVIKDSAGREVWRAERRTQLSRDGLLVFDVPAKLLPEGGYVLSIRGQILPADARPVADGLYTLRVRR